MAIDIFDDKQVKVLAQLRQRITFPEFAKSASTTPDAVAGLPDHCFAWPEKRAFPINNRANTYMSHVYFMATAANDHTIPDYVFDNFEKAASLFDLQPDIDNAAAALRHKKAAATTDDFGLVEKIAGKIQVKYPLMNAGHVKQAAAHFSENYHEFTTEQRRTIADNILVKAAKFGVAVTHPTVYQFAGCAADINMPAAIEEVEKRAYRTRNTEFGAGFAKLAEALKTVDKTDIAGARKLQELLVHLDKEAGLDRYYGKHYKNPLELLYEGTNMEYMFKKAEHTIDLADKKVPLASFLALSPQMYEDILGKDIKQNIMIGDQVDPEKVMAVIPTLPRPEAYYLHSQMQAAGLA